MKHAMCVLSTFAVVLLCATVNPSGQGGAASPVKPKEDEGRRLFEVETFGGNGRTCRTCHSDVTGTTSPQEAQDRFTANPGDPLFVHDGSDDGNGNGTTRIRSDATIIVHIPMHANVAI